MAGLVALFQPAPSMQVSFSRETLAKGTGMPPARAAYALESILCTIGKEAMMGRTLLVDCGVGVLAARGRVMKFTFVQVCSTQIMLYTALWAFHEKGWW